MNLWPENKGLLSLVLSSRRGEGNPARGEGGYSSAAGWTNRPESGNIQFMQGSPKTLIRSISRVLLIAWLSLHIFAAPFAATSAEAAKLASAGRQIDFLKDIQPVFSNSCYECHGPEKQKGGL